MPRSQSANRRKKTLPKVRRKPKSKEVSKTSSLHGTSLEYDEKATQFANYQRMGLLYDANQIGAVRDRVTGFKPRVNGPVAQPSGEAQASAADPDRLWRSTR